MSYPFSVSADEFKGKRVLVTGGTKGMGALIVERFVASGASVATTARSPLMADQHPSLFIRTDIGSPDGAGAVIERVNREWAASTYSSTAWADRRPRTAVFPLCRTRIGAVRST